mmetsp:Transcript_5720/g.12460  ORF Transcript_5720/g.12460 Transcript_5720/m.12460 type:complete len:244 (+) Transcript_5720:200-931(+)
MHARSMDVEAGWPKHEFEVANAVSQCEAVVQRGFLKKVFGLVSAQLALTVAIAATFMFVPPVHDFVLHTPSMLFVTFLSSLGFLFAASAYKDSFPTNLYIMAGFTASMGWSIGVVCAMYYARGLGLLVLEAVAITASVTIGLTLYTLKSKTDFSYLGAGLGAAVWALIFGGFIASLTAAPAMHLAMAVGGAVVFSLYIVYDVYMISRRLSPDEYVFGAISLYLDIVNLFLNILRILGEMSGRD